MRENVLPASSVPQVRDPRPTRRFDVDWLRVFGIAVVFLFHCSRFFDTESWHVKSPQTSPAVQFVDSFVLQWMMPLFFVLSGIGAYSALGHQSWSRFLASRVKRLVVPLVFGVFVVIVPWQIYLERVSQGQFQGSFLSFYPHYFDGWYMFGGNFAWMGTHLWYLELLFVFSALTLPVLTLLGSRRGGRLANGLVRVVTAPGMIFLLALPIVLTEFIANLPAIRYSLFGQRFLGGWSILSYLPMFLLGAVLGRSEELTRGVQRNRVVGLTVALLMLVVGFFLVRKYGLPRSGLFFAGLRAFACWACLIALCGFASCHLRFSNNFLRYANEAVLPFYILHQTIILTVGYYVLRLATYLWLEYLIIAAISFIVTIGVYELLVRRINLLRFLFGLKIVRRMPTLAVTP